MPQDYRHKPSFSTFPPVVKAAFIVFISAWAVFFTVQVKSTGNISVIHVTLAGMGIMLIFSLRNWGRLISAIYQLIMAGALANTAIISTGPFRVAWIACALVFFASTVLLLLPPTVRFFKEAANPPSSGRDR